MNQNSVVGDMIGATLRQLGACKIEELNSNLHIVDFKLENGLEVSYVFNITKGNKFFLQRMKPYAIPHGKFADDREIIEFIKNDIAKFKNASNSRNFEKFLKISEKGNEFVYWMECVFLNHNVDEEVLDSIEKDIDVILGNIKDCRIKSREIEVKIEE